MNVSMPEKRSICKRFTADVLRKRVLSLIEDRRAYVQGCIDELVTPEIRKAHAVLITAAKENEDLANMVGLDSECDFHASDLISEITVNMINIHSFNSGEPVNLDDSDFDSETVIKLRVERIFWTGCGIDLDEIDPTKSTTPENKAFTAREEKLSKDSLKLYTTSLDAIRKVRTEAAIEKACPELIPYLTATSGCTGTDLADMASCMRVKEDC